MIQNLQTEKKIISAVFGLWIFVASSICVCAYAHALVCVCESVGERPCQIAASCPKSSAYAVNSEATFLMYTHSHTHTHTGKHTYSVRCVSLIHNHDKSFTILLMGCSIPYLMLHWLMLCRTKSSLFKSTFWNRCHCFAAVFQSHETAANFTWLLESIEMIGLFHSWNCGHLLTVFQLFFSLAILANYEVSKPWSFHNRTNRWKLDSVQLFRSCGFVKKLSINTQFLTMNKIYK